MTPPLRPKILATLLATLVLALSLGPGAASGEAAKRPMYWGAWIGEQLTGEQAPWDMNAVTQLQTRLNKGLSLIQFASPFADCGQGDCSFYRFPTRPMQAVRDYGAIPFFSWSSTGNGQPSDPAFQLARVIDGTYDGHIRSFAAEAKAWGHPFFLRFNWEMNGTWFPWGERANGNSRGQYKAAWRHVHMLFDEVGATNATWVWCPYAYQTGQASRLRSYYPGSRFVDWTCLDGFNWGRNASNPVAWTSFRKIFASAYDEITKKIARDKPMILAELATNGGARARVRWIKGMFRALPTRFPRVRGLIWYDQHDRDIAWPLETYGAVEKTFRRALRGPGFTSNSFHGLTGSPIPPPE